MKRYTLLMLLIAAAAGLLSIPADIAYRIFRSRGTGMPGDAATAASGL